MEKLQAILDQQGVTGVVIDKTPHLTTTRADEISLWLQDHPEVTRFVILDDSTDGCDAFGDRFIKTSFNTGLTQKHADRAIEVLCAP